MSACSDEARTGGEGRVAFGASAARGRQSGLGLRYAALTYMKFSLCTSGKQLVLEETIIKQNIKTKRVPDQWLRPGVRAATSTGSAVPARPLRYQLVLQSTLRQRQPCCFRQHHLTRCLPTTEQTILNTTQYVPISRKSKLNVGTQAQRG
ncbi:unnamed protein product [Spodoptera littoralis]|uniref:Uncharacterized protein n=1 Tax=Spodoptera littoralis TaxID=7109 RepID=A0A9P0IIX8_SPOLI|nr:unnamed protein product [Spodoptera littoralis]CAH1647541.1 unnamed protein product [Spodoptera littoralis]